MNNDEMLDNLQDLIDRIPPGVWPDSMAIRESDRETLRMARQLLIVRANTIEDQWRNIEDKNKRIDELKVLLASKHTEIAALMDTRVDLNDVQEYIYKARYALEMAHQAALDEISFYQVARRIIDDIQEQFSPDRSYIPF